MEEKFVKPLKVYTSGSIKKHTSTNSKKSKNPSTIKPSITNFKSHKSPNHRKNISKHKILGKISDITKNTIICHKNYVKQEKQFFNHRNSMKKYSSIIKNIKVNKVEVMKKVNLDEKPQMSNLKNISQNEFIYNKNNNISFDFGYGNIFIRNEEELIDTRESSNKKANIDSNLDNCRIKKKFRKRSVIEVKSKNCHKTKPKLPKIIKRLSIIEELQIESQTSNLSKKLNITIKSKIF